jgi:DNA-binding GntR family transcriptional regulator
MPTWLQLKKPALTTKRPPRQAGDMRRAIRLSGDFHLLIADVANHQTLGRILRELTSRTSLMLMTYSSATHEFARRTPPACGCREHRALLDAIRLRDAREAGKRMREHLTPAGSRSCSSRTAARHGARPQRPVWCA